MLQDSHLHPDRLVEGLPVMEDPVCARANLNESAVFKSCSTYQINRAYHFPVSNFLPRFPHTV